jgi:uncharacterized membrane protein YqhA
MPLCSSAEGIAAAEALRQAKLAGAENLVKACTTVTATGVMWQTIIHTIFILSAIGIAATDKLMGSPSKASPLANGGH